MTYHLFYTIVSSTYFFMEVQVGNWEQFARWAAANIWVRPWLKLIWWGLIFRCPVCGRELSFLELSDLRAEVRTELLHSGEEWMLKYAYTCKEESCPDHGQKAYLIR